MKQLSLTHALIRSMSQFDGAKLLIVDENFNTQDTEALNYCENLYVLTNRYDLHIYFQAKAINSYFADFENLPEHFPSRFTCLGYRLSKEKAIVYRVFNLAASILSKDGHLLFIGHKQEGFKTYLKALTQHWGSAPTQTSLSDQYKLAHLKAAQTEVDGFDDKSYPLLRSIATIYPGGLYSKPGCYGWNKIDSGSQFLAEQLTKLLDPTKINEIVDLGCGYGYLSVALAKQHPAAYITATDNNAAALAACQYNFKVHQVNGMVCASDCGDTFSRKYDLVISNPPFHQGFNTSNSLSIKFISRAAQLQRKGNKALFVVNSFLPYETWAKPYFKSIDVIANNNSFKIIGMNN